MGDDIDPDATLVWTWRRWDEVCTAMPRHPSADYGRAAAIAMNDACRTVAARLGISVNLLRERLATHRRAERAYETCLRQAGAL